MYNESIAAAAKELKIRDVSVLVTGATGLIGSCAIDVMIAANKEQNANIRIYALGRTKEYNGPLVKTTLEEIIVNTF